MISFVTLFLGLVLGPQPIEVAVAEGVARVEIRLGDQLAVRLGPPSWTGEIDFGPELLPQRLEALAFDAAGEEIARAVQWINLPQDPAVAKWVLDGEAGSRVARLHWESVAGTAPIALRVSFDGRPLKVEDPNRIELPPYRPEQLHFLRAELDFEHNVTSVAEVTFGGTYGERLTTELTAMALIADGRRPPELETLRHRLVAEGRKLEVVAIDRGSSGRGTSGRGPAEILMVVDRDFPRVMSDLWLRYQQRGWRRPTLVTTGLISSELRLRFVYPVAEHRQAVSGSYKLFPASQEYSDTALYPLLSAMRPLEGKQRLADAVAVAGLTAAGHRRRRTVVLALGHDPVDASDLDPGMVRRYLAALNVPLQVWYPGDELPASVAAWGEVKDVAEFRQLDGVFRDLKRRLDQQWVIWLDGVHLPQEVEFGEAVEGLRIAR